jgi:hypothetical protein
MFETQSEQALLIITVAICNPLLAGLAKVLMFLV